MKTLIPRILSWTCGLGLCLGALAQPADPPAGDPPSEASPPAMERPDLLPEEEPPVSPPEETPDTPGSVPVPAPKPEPEPAFEPPPEPVFDPESEPVFEPEPGTAPEPAPAPRTTGPAAPRGRVPTDAPEARVPTPTQPIRMVAEGEKGLRLNFRNAPLELVLDYLSEAAGFIIDLRTDVRGTVDVWSNQPLTTDEAVSVLNAALNRNGYAAVRNERLLTIVSKEDAKKLDIPVISGNDPAGIPKTEEIVTQIIPVRFINATQLTKDLTPLLPSQTTMTANEGGNALVITDTQVNIRRMAEIVRALDTAISSTSAIRVFTLKYADAKALAAVIQELFESQETTTRGGNPMQRFFRGMRGGPAGNEATSGNARVATPRVVATSDDRSNSLVVSAPEEQMVVIEDLVRQVDTNVDDVTELRVFNLKYADPEETADMLSSLFPDPTSTQNGRGQFQFGGGRFGGRRGVQQSTTESTRLIKQARVIAVPDLRTGSIVVSASRELMTQIIPVVEALDSDPRRKQKVFVIDVENTDPQTVQNIIQDLFPSQYYGTGTYNRNTSQQVGNQLNTRASSSATRQSQNLRSTTQNRSTSNIGR